MRAHKFFQPPSGGGSGGGAGDLTSVVAGGLAAIMGDSIGAQGFVSTAGVIGYENVGYAAALRQVSRGRLYIPPEYNFAESGSDTNQWLISNGQAIDGGVGQHTAAAASDAEYVFMVLPTNDVGHNPATITVAQTKANLTTIFQTLSAAGKIIIVQPILPRFTNIGFTAWANGQTIAIGDYRTNVVSGTTEVYCAKSAGTTATGSEPTGIVAGVDAAGADTIIWRNFSTIDQTKEYVLYDINRWFLEFVHDHPEMGIIVSDCTPNFIDHTSAHGHPLVRRVRDGLHPEHDGCLVIADKMWSSIKPFVPDIEIRCMSAGDKYNATSNPGGNLLENGLMTGAAGTVTSPNLGVAPTSWTLGRSTTTGIGTLLGTGAQVARTDGEPGEAYKVTLSGTPTANNIQILVTQSEATDYVAGDVVEAVMEIEWDAGCVGLAGITAEVKDTDGAVNSYSRDADAFSGAFYTTTEGRGKAYGNEPIILRTARQTVIAGSTSLRAGIVVFTRANVAAGGVIRILRGSLRKVI